jgi:peptidoglycan/LPS O-acetylase OafA/YrhL
MTWSDLYQSSRTVIGSLIVVEAVSLLVGAIVHLGVEIPIGIMVLSEPQIIPATIVEGFCGLLLAGSAYGIFFNKSWMWQVSVIAQVVALGGVLLGIVALAVGAGPNTASNALYHRVMLVVLGGGLLLLWIPSTRTMLAHDNQVSQRN